MSSSRKAVVTASALTLCLAALGSVPEAHAQGCVASRLNAPAGPTDPEGNDYYLPQGQWQATFGYRNYMSHRHFVGSIEQDGSPQAVEGDRSKNEVINHVNIPEVLLSYGVSDRFGLTLDVPIDIFERRNPWRAASATSPAVPAVYTTADGIGDVSLVSQFWVANPKTSGSQNLSLGLGIKLPTGQDDVQGTFLQVVHGALQDYVHAVDQSIQPGDGGFGIIAEVQAFKTFGQVTAYASGQYLFNPRGTNGVLTARSDPNEAVMSVADQFGARIGAGMPLKFVSGLAVSLGGRLEGVPSSDVFGSSAGFRRPGYSIAIEPGVSYTWKKSALSFSFPYFVRRDRTQSYADKLASAATGTFVNGDAAFADYEWIFGFTRRF